MLEWIFDNPKNFSLGCLLPILVVLAIVCSVFSVYTVPSGSVGIVTHFGAVDHVAQPGLGWKTPFVDGIEIMSVQTIKDQTDTSAASKDLQSVTATIAVNYHLDSKFAKDVFVNVGPNYQDVLIAPAIQNIFKATTAQYTAEQLITNREAVRGAAETSLKEQLSSYHVVVENFSIVNFDFSKDYDAAIEAKQVAQQQVETSRQKLAQAQVDAETAKAQAQGQADANLVIAQGKADANAALLKSNALTPEYLQYLAILQWDGHLPSVVGGATPFINISSPK